MFLLFQLEVIPSDSEFVWTVSVGVAIAFLIGVYFFARNTSKRIIKPIEMLENGVEEIKKGNLEHEIDFKGTNELSDLKDTFNSMSRELEGEIKKRKLAEKSREEFIQNITHDVNTPLNNITTHAEILRKDKTLNETEKNKYLEIIETSGFKASKLLDALIGYSEIKDDECQLNFEKNNVTEFFKNKIIEYLPIFETKNIEYEVNIEENPIRLLIDSNELDRALDNVISNSIKYNESDYKMTFTLEDHINYINMVICDKGIGIPDEYKEKVFEPSIRVEASRHTEGSGLGLSIAKKIIEAHGGTITLDKNYNEGCKFIIQLMK